MKLNEFLKKIREEQDYSFGEIAEKLGYTRGMINDIEKGRAPVSEKLLRSYIKLFPRYEKMLLKVYLEEKIPFGMEEKIKIEAETEKRLQLAKEQKIKIYNYDSSGDGRVNLSEYKEVTFMLSHKIPEDSLLVEVTDELMRPNFIDGDILLFEKEEFINWENLNRKLVFVKINGEVIIRKLIFKSATPYLVAFNDEVYPDVEVNEKIIFLGQLSELLKRKKIKNITF